MKKMILAAMAISLFGATAAYAANVRTGTISGVISDSMCKTDHTAMKMGSSAACVKSCINAGSKAVLLDEKTKTAYVLSDKKAATQFAGKRVSVSGHIDDSTKMIHLHSIKSK